MILKHTFLSTSCALICASISLLSTSCTSSSPASSSYEDGVDINVNIGTIHSVDGIDEFDREKYITIHASLGSSDWDGDNVIPNLREEFLTKYDVYLGRESRPTGTLNREVYEDPNRPGYPDVERMKVSGQRNREAYNKKREALGFKDLEFRTKNMLLVSAFHPLWPDGKKTTAHNWALSQEDTEEAPFGTASGVFSGTYLKEYYGGVGEPMPKYLEIVNEPDWELIPLAMSGNEEWEMSAIAKMAKFHSSVAQQVKKICPEVQVGGFTCAFPNFDYYDFKRWDYRWKQFIDLAGDDMDFWSIHLYDFPCKVEEDKSVMKRLRKGSNIEATLDLLEQYSMMKYDNLKPLVITEYSCSAHEIRFDPWTPYRDWLYVKSANSMLMTFMDHPQSIAYAVPFFTLKSEWGRKEGADGHPYRSRLMRQQFEAESETGDKWVYTDFVHFYQLWADVRGKRVDISANNVDIQTDAYVNGNKLYVIANNLEIIPTTLNINLNGGKGNSIVSIKKKHYHNPTGDGAGIIEEEVYVANKIVEIGAEGAVILEYTYQNPIELTHTSEEVKYYAEEYYKQIKGGENNIFNFKDVELSKGAKATLRVSISREHRHSLVPTITINGTQIEVPESYRGEPQYQRERFYGMIDIDVDAKLLTENTQVGVSFAENGGQIASVTMRVYNTTKN